MKSPSELSLTSGELAAMLNKILRTSEIGAQVLEIRLFRERTFEDPTRDKELKSEIVPIKSGTDIHPGSRLFVSAEFMVDGKVVPVMGNLYLDSDGKSVVEHFVVNELPVKSRDESSERAWRGITK